MRPKKKVESATAEKFRKWFAEKFAGRRVLKTAYQFANWMAEGDDNVREEFLSKFFSHTQKVRCAASWENAAKFYDELQAKSK